MLALYKRVRRWFHTRRAKRSAGSYVEPLHANRKTKFTKKTFIGKNTHYNGLIVHGRGSVLIGDNFHCGFGCSIRTDNHNYSGDALPYDATYVTKDVTIGDNVWLGEGVLVLPGVLIGEGAIIQARSVIVSNIPPLAIAGGHPCRVFKYRDAQRYQDLKSSGRFL